MLRKLLICLIFIASCSQMDPSEKVARDFMDAYYTLTNLQRAAELSDGLALVKITESLALTQDQTVDVATKKPEIRYELIKGDWMEDTGSYFFSVEITPPEFKKIFKRVRIRVRKREVGWRVTQFSEVGVTATP
jgi:hypothetical protein